MENNLQKETQTNDAASVGCNDLLAFLCFVIAPDGREVSAVFFEKCADDVVLSALMHGAKHVRQIKRMPKLDRVPEKDKSQGPHHPFIYKSRCEILGCENVYFTHYFRVYRLGGIGKIRCCPICWRAMGLPASLRDSQDYDKANVKLNRPPKT